MRFAKIVFNVAGIWGVVALAPLYFLEDRIAIEAPPAITHPEHFYGFIGLGLAWQVAFFIIACDPVRYRPLMLAGVLEKLSFSLAVIVLFMQHRLDTPVFLLSLLDLMFAVLFAVAYSMTAATERTAERALPGRQ